MFSVHDLKITSAYIILLVFIASALALVSAIVHLIYVAKQKSKQQSKSKRDNNKQILFLITLTVLGIFSFFISITLMIAVIFQIILLDGHKLSPNSVVDDFYSVSSQITDYLIVIFDQFGHLCMLSVFVVRLKMCFANSVFGYSPNMMRLIYSCLIALSVGSSIIVIQIITGVNAQNIIVSQIVWELLIEIMCIWLLYLFVSKLHCLLQMASIEPHHHRPIQPHGVPKSEGLVNVMLKMTLLVLIAVSGSIFSVIGNVFIEIHELQSIPKHTADIQMLYAFLLPAIDIVLASFMLYLQFDFTTNVYSTMCSKIDAWFIECILLVGQVPNETEELNALDRHMNVDTQLVQQINISSVRSGAPTPPIPQRQCLKPLSLNITEMETECDTPEDVLRLISPSPSPMPQSFVVCDS